MKKRKGAARFRQFPWGIEIDGVERAWLRFVLGGTERIDRFVEEEVILHSFDDLEVRGVTDDRDFWDWLVRGDELVRDGVPEIPPDLPRDLVITFHSEAGEELRRVMLVGATCSHLIGEWDGDNDEGRFGETILVPQLIREAT